MATYFVSTTGSNGAAGTYSAPWRNLTYAYTRVSPGDTVYVRGGTYTSESNSIDFWSKNGSAAAWYTFRNFPSEAPILQGSGSGTWTLANSSFVKYIGLRWTNWGNGFCTGYDAACHDIWFENCEFDTTQREVFRVRYNSYNVTARNCRMHAERSADNTEGCYIGTREDGTPNDNTHHVTIQGCTIYNCGTEGIDCKPGTHDNIFENNYIYNCWTTAGQVDWGTIEIDCSVDAPENWPTNPNHIIRGNIVSGTKTGIALHTGCQCYNNLVYGMTGSNVGIYVSNSRYADSYTRYVYHNTVDVPSARAITRVSGTWVCTNNIGPATTGNMATSDAYYADKPNGCYYPAKGTAPLTTSSTNLLTAVPRDRLGYTRDTSPTYGCYERGTVKAASAASAAVTTAIAASASGEIVWIPPGTVTWASNVSTGGKGIRLEGAGIGLTNITRGAATICTLAMPSATYVTELCGITFNLANNGAACFGMSGGFLNSFRVHHCNFTNCRDRVWEPYFDGNQISGIWDNCTFVEVAGGSKVLSLNGADPEDNSVASFAHGLGTNLLTYVEDCTFTYADTADGCLDAYNGARYAFRYNTVSTTNVEHHGCDSSQGRGTIAFEITNNHFVNGGTNWRCGYYRSGVGIVKDNAFLGGGYNGGLVHTNYRSGGNFFPYGNCNGSSTWDQNTPGSQGYACLDQIGWKFNHLAVQSGGTATKVGNYLWNNLLAITGSQISCTSDTYYDTDNPLVPLHVIINRDFYHGGIVAQTSATAPFNGTTGVGWGLLSRRPTTCTTGVAYWATDDNKLYKATATNTWSEGWVPYQYPHPLRTEEPVSGLSVSNPYYTTTFGTDETVISEGGRWLNGLANGLVWSNVQTTAGRAIGTQNGDGDYDDSTAILQGAWTADQEAWATVYVGGALGTLAEVEILLRFSTTANVNRGYEVLFSVDGDYCQIVRWNGTLGNYTYVEENGNLPRALQTGDIVKARIVGSTITGYLNGVVVVQGTNTTWTDGTPGIGFYQQSAVNGNFGLSDFTAQNYGSTPGSPPVGTPVLSVR